ncbi:hypothetical protein Taro_027612 [Colocasia esculenta]|uniref:CCHC-type domain-containing protein n=1 Tax=Colocasia esculenta TaxID=4460 RepID=A0A843VKM4_COLES|nr:hypothetical protein [Colocasia esculenta]
MPQCVVSLARLRPVHGRRTRVKHVPGLTGLDEAFHHSWYQTKAVVMADRREWGGGGDGPEESTQWMIERIWESLTEIHLSMDQQAPVPPVTGEAVPVAPVPPPPGVEVKEEDGEVVSKFSRVVVSQRWRNRNKVPPGSLPFHQAINCNQPGHLIRNCPYPREYGYGRGVQQPQQSQQPPMIVM